MNVERALRSEEKPLVFNALLESGIAPEPVCHEAVETSRLIALKPSLLRLTRGIRPLVAYFALRRRASGITLGRQVYVRHNLFAKNGDIPLFLLTHEVAHVVQFIRDGTTPFLVRYLGEYAARRLQGLSDRHAYLAISYEEEARHAEACLASDRD